MNEKFLHIIPLSIARLLGMKRYCTGLPCPKGHICERYTKQSRCLHCAILDCKSYSSKNRESLLLYKSSYYEENRAHLREVCRKDYILNTEKYLLRTKAWQQANPLKISEYKDKNPEIFRAQWRRRRAKKRGADGSHTREEIISLFALQKSKCASCFKSIKLAYHADHIYPLSKGGSDYISNIQLLCPSCNQKKHAKDPIDWANENGRLL